MANRRHAPRTLEESAALKVAQALRKCLIQKQKRAAQRQDGSLPTQGRPLGARDRRQRDLAQEVVDTYGDPIMRQVMIATMPLEKLATLLDCTKLEAATEQRQSAAVVMPYIHSKRPVSVDVSNRRFVHLTIVDEHAAPTIEAAGDDTQVQVLSRLEYASNAGTVDDDE